MEERPLQEAREALQQSQADAANSETMQTPPPTGGVKNQTPLIIGGVVLVLILILVGLSLPPISLIERLGLGGNNGANENDGAVVADDPEATPAGQLSLPGEIDLILADGAGTATVAVAPDDAVLEAVSAALPAHLSFTGSVYAITKQSEDVQGRVALTTPAGVDSRHLDLYKWDGTSWSFVPVRLDGDQYVSREGRIADAYAFVNTSALSTKVVAAELLPMQNLPAAVLPALSELVVGTLTLTDDGTLSGQPTTAPAGSYRQYLRVTNTGVIVDQGSITTLLNDPDLQAAQISQLKSLVGTGGYAGVNLDYQGVPASLRAAYTDFVGQLANALNRQNSVLALTLSTPLAAANGWDTGGHDWAALGQLANVVFVQLPLDPGAYGDQGAADSLIGWAVTQIDRYKLTPILSAYAIDNVEGGAFNEIPNSQALANFGAITFLQGAAEVEPGTPVEVGLSGTASTLEWDRDMVAYRYGYEQSGQAHTVWLINEAALSHRMRFASSYFLRGIAVRGLSDVGDGDGYMTAFGSYRGAAEAPQPSPAGIVWTISDETGGVVASDTNEALTFLWEDTSAPGAYSISAEFAQGDTIVSLGELSVAIAAPDVVEEEEEEVEEVVEEEPDTTTPTVTVYTPGDADAVVNVNANVRVGPGLGYGTISGGAAAGTLVSLIGRNSDRSWYQIVLPTGEEGWIFNTLLTINSGFNVGGLALVEVDPPAGGGSSGGTPPPVTPPGTITTGFGLGGQTHTLANPTLMHYSGMTWVKFQHKWGSGDTPDAVAGRIQQAHGNGFKVLLSIPGANTYPSSIDFSGYINFLGGVAALGPDAIEVWNEMNIDFEWPAGQIDPASYVNNMLAPAYNAIKSANPNVMVISGAPAPTGFDNGTNAWSDQRYMNGVAAAGGGSYMDCVGVHYNEGILPPSQTSGDPRVPSGHYTRYYWGMVNTYYNAFGGARPLCFTELGYISGDGFPGLPTNFGWGSTTSVAEHAAWLAEAGSISAGAAQVRMMIIFNVDFNYFDINGDPQAAYGMVRPDGSCPACDALHNVFGSS